MNNELFEALEMLEKEKGIPADYMIEKIEAALISAYKKEYGNNTNVRVDFNREKKDVKVFQQKEIVETVENPETQISLEDAKALSKRNALGGIVETQVKPQNFRRLSASAAKSVIIQAIREGERNAQRKVYEERHEEIITATVDSLDSETGNILLNTDNGRAVLTPREQVPSEIFHIGDKIKVFVSAINREDRGPLVTLSRTNAGLVRRLFELQIPEIADGIVIIKSIAREAGSRSKIAVYSREDDVDAVGSCIGNKGCRINAVIDEIRGEKVDVIRYSEDPCEFVASALSPAKIKSVCRIGEREYRVISPVDQLSLAIGKDGQNVRLAARLTGFKIDIKAEGSEFDVEEPDDLYREPEEKPVDTEEKPVED